MAPSTFRQALCDLRVWRDTSVVAGGATRTLPTGILGYEWNMSPEDEYRPASLIKLSETTLDWPRHPH